MGSGTTIDAGRPSASKSSLSVRELTVLELGKASRKRMLSIWTTASVISGHADRSCELGPDALTPRIYGK